MLQGHDRGRFRQPRPTWPEVWVKRERRRQDEEKPWDHIVMQDSFYCSWREEGVERTSRPWQGLSPVSWQYAEHQGASAVPQEQVPSAGLCSHGAVSIEKILKQGRMKTEFSPEQASAIKVT